MRVALPVVVIALLSAAGCTTPGPAGPTPSATPLPSPTYTCTAAPTAGPCTAERAEEEQQEAANYAAAEAAYRAFTTERNRLLIAGGTDVATATMKKYAGGPYLANVLKSLARLKSNGAHGSSGIRITKLEALPSSHRTGSPAGELTLAFCEDGSGNRVINSDGKVVGQGFLAAGNLYARQVSGTWRIWDDQSERVAACPK